MIPKGSLIRTCVFPTVDMSGPPIFIQWVFLHREHSSNDANSMIHNRWQIDPRTLLKLWEAATVCYPMLSIMSKHVVTANISHVDVFGKSEDICNIVEISSKTLEENFHLLSMESHRWFKEIIEMLKGCHSWPFFSMPVLRHDISISAKYSTRYIAHHWPTFLSDKIDYFTFPQNVLGKSVKWECGSNDVIKLRTALQRKNAADLKMQILRCGGNKHVLKASTRRSHKEQLLLLVPMSNTSGCLRFNWNKISQARGGGKSEISCPYFKKPYQVLDLCYFLTTSWLNKDPKVVLKDTNKLCSDLKMKENKEKWSSEIKRAQLLCAGQELCLF